MKRGEARLDSLRGNLGGDETDYCGGMGTGKRRMNGVLVFCQGKLPVRFTRLMYLSGGIVCQNLLKR